MSALPLSASESSTTLSTAKTSTNRASTGASFSSLVSNPNLLTTIAKLGYSEPTAIQLQAIPAIKAGGDLIGLAQTGTGKTAAYLLPIIERLLSSGASVKPKVLIVVPTRELAQQVSESIRELTEQTQIRTTAVFGGVRVDRQRMKLKRGTEIVVGCPGRILDLVGQRMLKLDQVETLVLDEADQMLDMGFIEPVKEIVSLLSGKKQSLMFSATMSPEIRRLTNIVLKDPKQIQVSPISAPSLLSHSAYSVSNSQKESFLVQYLKKTKTDSVIVFTRTKHGAKSLVRALKSNDIEALELHGNLSQSQRTRTMLSFRGGECAVMVATDIAARGIDISTISHVVNFDLPSNHEAYLHRTGRTARAARSGEAISLVAQNDEGKFRRIEKSLNLKVTRQTLDGFVPAPRAAKAERGERGPEREFDRRDRRRDSRSDRQPSAERSVRSERTDRERTDRDDRDHRGVSRQPDGSNFRDQAPRSREGGDRGGYRARRPFSDRRSSQPSYHDRGGYQDRRYQDRAGFRGDGFKTRDQRDAPRNDAPLDRQPLTNESTSEINARRREGGYRNANRDRSGFAPRGNSYRPRRSGSSGAGRFSR